MTSEEYQREYYIALGIITPGTDTTSRRFICAEQRAARLQARAAGVDVSPPAADLSNPEFVGRPPRRERARQCAGNRNDDASSR